MFSYKEQYENSENSQYLNFLFIRYCTLSTFPDVKPSRSIPYTVVDVYTRYYTYIFIDVHIDRLCVVRVSIIIIVVVVLESVFFSHSFYIPARRELKYILLWLQQYTYTLQEHHCCEETETATSRVHLQTYIYYISIGYYNIYYYYTLRVSRPSRGVWNVRHAVRNRIQTPDGAPSEYFGI